MDGNPWGSAWAAPEKEVVQEVTLQPKAADKWLTSPASGDIGAAWGSSSQWDAKPDSKSTWKPAASTFASEGTPWESAFDARAADVLGGQEISHSLEPTPIEEVFRDQHKPETSLDTSPKDRDVDIEEQSHPESLTPAHDLPHEDEKPAFSTPFEVQEEETSDTWRALENAAVIVDDDGPAWETAWKPDADEGDARTESPAGPPDDWVEAAQEKVLRDARVRSEVMEMILTRYRELESTLWPGEDLETAREGPAPRMEWQGGLENVEGLTALVNRYLPPNTSAPPIHFDTTKIASSLQNAMKLTKSYGMIQKSPLTRLIRTSESWEQSSRSGAGSSTSFSLESWLAKRGTSALSIPSPYLSANSEAESQRKATGLAGRLSLDRGKSSSASPSPRASQDGMQSIMSVTAAATSSSAASPTNASFSAESQAPSAVARFLGRFSRRAEDTAKQPSTVNLRPDELDFLDMMPAMNPNGQIASAIQKELESTGGYHGQALGVGSSIISTPAPSRHGMIDSRPRNKLTSSLNLGQISSKDFDALLDAQIIETEDERIRESLIAASMISAPVDGKYSKLGIPLFGSKPPNGAQPLSKGSGSSLSNTLFDDDDFDAFLSSPAPPKPPMQPQMSQPTPSFALNPSSFSAQNTTPSFMRASSPPNTLRSGSSKVSPTPSRSSTVAIMSPSGLPGSRPTTPATMSIAPLLPPPPGSRPIRGTPVNQQGDLLNDLAFVSSTTPTHSRSGSRSGISGPKATQMGSLLSLPSPPATIISKPMAIATPKATAPSATPTSGGLSAQDLSFFEGL